MTEARLKKEKQIIKELEKKGVVINCLNDRVFKAVFSDESMKGILSYMISYITGLDENYVRENLNVVNPYEPVHSIFLREKTHDLKVLIKEDTIILKMDQFNDNETKFRNSAHYHEGIVKKYEKSQKSKDMGYMIQISFDNKSNEDELISKIMMMNVDNYKIDQSESKFMKYKINLSKLK